MSWDKLVERYKEHNNFMMEQIKEKNKELSELRKQNKQYREALTFYAEENNYDYDVKVDSISYVGDQSNMKFYRLDSKILNDKGERARKALEGDEE